MTADTNRKKEKSKQTSSTLNIKTVESQPSSETSASEEADRSAVDEQKHYEYVQTLALEFFDSTRKLHELGSSSRNVLTQAALNYDLTIPREKKKQFQISYSTIKKLNLEQLSLDEQKRLAAVIALHQKKIKRKKFNGLNLSPINQREVLTITAMLRIAVGLDDSRSQGTEIKHIESNREKILMIVEGPEALTDAEAAQRCSQLWKKIGYPNLRIIESAEAKDKYVPYPEPTERPYVESKDLVVEAARKVMRFNFALMLQEEDGTRIGDDIEALHDMRVATRRLRASFEVFRKCFEPGILKPYLKGLRSTGRALGKVRDFDVLLDNMKNYQASLSVEQWEASDVYIQACELERESARIEMLSYLDSKKFASFKRKFNIFLNAVGTGERKYSTDQQNPKLVCEVAPMLIYTRFASVRSYDSIIEKATIEQLHMLRIEFKNFRYTVEYFREVLGTEVESVINILKKQQDHLGRLNDARIAMKITNAFIKPYGSIQKDLLVGKKDYKKAVDEYLEYRQEELDNLMTSFPDTWSEFNSAEFKRNLAFAISVL